MTRYSIAILLLTCLAIGPRSLALAADPAAADKAKGESPKATATGKDTPSTSSAPIKQEIDKQENAKRESADFKQIDIDRWIEDLDSSSFTKREEASDKLKAAGKAAIPALVRAATKGDLETASRAIAVLRKALDSSDEATRDDAKTALQKVADSDSSSAARKAKQALEAKEQADAPPPQQMNPFGGRIIVNGGQLVINGGGVTAKSVSVSTVNGVKETNVSEDGKKIKIVDDPAKGIKIEYKHKRGDKDVTDKFEGKNADDLKKNHPEGYKLYKEYADNNANGANAFGAGGMGAIQLQLGVAPAGGNPIVPPMQANPLQPGPIKPLQIGPRRIQGIGPQAQAPVPLVPIPGPNAPLQAVGPASLATGSAAQKSLEVSGMMMKTLTSELELLEQSNSLGSVDQASKDELKKQLKELKQRIESIDKKLAP